jgi:hypothetical protein
MISALDTNDVALICLCYLESATPAQVRYAVRRIRRNAHGTAVVVSLLAKTDHVGDLVAPNLYPGVEPATGSLRNIVGHIVDFVEAGRVEKPQAITKTASTA